MNGNQENDTIHNAPPEPSAALPNFEGMDDS
jgi:hypothetical protein